MFDKEKKFSEIVKDHGKIEMFLGSCDIPINTTSQVTYSCATAMFAR